MLLLLYLFELTLSYWAQHFLLSIIIWEDNWKIILLKFYLIEQV